MTVRLLTEEQKNLIVGKTFSIGNYFNPIQDNNNNWIISNEEILGCNIEEFIWVKDLPEIEYIEKIYDSEF